LSRSKLTDRFVHRNAAPLDRAKGSVGIHGKDLFRRAIGKKRN
jgi:hypothetical protein